MVKNILKWILVILVIAFVYSGFKNKTNLTTLPTTTNNEQEVTLPASFTMEIIGNFSDQTLYNKPGGEAGSAFLLSSGKDELEGEVQYTYAEGDGYLIVCEIKDKKWVTNDSTPRDCHSLEKLPTTRTELVKQITNGELERIECGSNNNIDLCYELK